MKHSITILGFISSFLFTITTQAMHTRRPVRMPSRPATMRSKISSRAPHKVAQNRSYSTKAIERELEHQIRVTKKDEQHAYKYLAYWQNRTYDCAWTGKCQGGGQCTKESNCFENIILFHACVQTVQKKLVHYEKELAVLTYGKEKK